MIDVTSVQVRAILRGNTLLLQRDFYTPEDFEVLIFKDVSVWYAQQLKNLGLIEDFDEAWIYERMHFIVEEHVWTELEGRELDEYFLKAGYTFLKEFHEKHGLPEMIDGLFMEKTMAEMLKEFEDSGFDPVADNPAL